MSWLIDQSLRRLRKGDIVGCGKAVLWSLSERYYERRYGIASSAPALNSELGTDPSLSGQYDPTTYLLLRKIFRHLWRHGRNNDHGFLDVGCGKGRVTRVAAAHPYRHVIGIELSAELVNLARQNLERCRGRMTCDQVQVEVADAAAFVIPDTVGTIFMYNPFWGEVMNRFMRNVRDSFERAPREITIVFVNPSRFEPQRYPWIKTAHAFSGFYPHWDRDMQVNLYTVVAGQ